MPDMRTMTAEERLKRVQDYIALLEGFVLPLVERDLGAGARTELQELWKAGTETVPTMEPEELAVRVAYRNWMFEWGTAYDFVRERLGDRGAEAFERADVEALRRANSGASVAFLKVMWALAPGTAFRAFAKQMAFELQTFTPVTVTELSKSRLAVEIPRCEVLDHPGGEPTCLAGCQVIYPRFLREAFDVKMTTDRRGRACTVTLAPA